MDLEQRAVRLCRSVARVFPHEFRRQFDSEVEATAERMICDAARRGGLFAVLLLLPRLLGDLAIRVVVEHWHDLLRDARYASRLLLRSPGFTVAAATCLAIGTGLTATMYAQVQSTMLGDLPGVRNASGLVRLQRATAFGTFEQFRDHAGVFSSVAAYMGPVPLAVSDRGGKAERLWGHVVTPEYFAVLGVDAAAGRVFGSDERMRGNGLTTVLSERLWRSRFGSDPSIVGQSIRVNGQLTTIIGVTPSGFLGASPITSAADLWIPTTASVQLAPELARMQDRGAAFEIIGRLTPGVTVAGAEATLESIARGLEQIPNDPAKDGNERRIRLLPGGRMFPVRDDDLPRVIGFPLVLVSLVLLMACGNVANLMLARSASRHAEIAVRLSLGARRGRILRQLLTENLLIVVLGSVGGALFAGGLLSAFESLRPMIPGYVGYDVEFHWQSFAVAVLVASTSSVLFGMAPALRASRQDVYGGLKRIPSRLRARRWLGLRNVLVFQQVTVSHVLVLLTAFVVVGWQRAANLELGFDTRHLYFVTVDPIRDGHSPQRVRDFFERLPDRLRQVGGVQSVSVAQTLPLAMASSEMMMGAKTDFVAGTTLLGATRAERIGARFFETVRTAVIRGREFTEDDEDDTARVVIVNQRMAENVWPGDDPVGRTVDLDGRRWQVVGVVRDMRSAFPLTPTVPAVYRPITPSGFTAPSRHGVTVAVRVAPGFDAATTLRREIETIDPQVTVFEVKRMTEEIEQALYLVRAATFVYGGIGVFALILASVGLAGVTAYAVARRTHEIGIRVTLGAHRGRVLWLVLREGATIVIAGSLVGLALSIAATRALSSVLETVAETTRTSIADPTLLIGTPAALLALALLACYLPARRAVHIDPVRALRAE